VKGENNSEEGRGKTTKKAQRRKEEILEGSLFPSLKKGVEERKGSRNAFSLNQKLK